MSAHTYLYPVPESARFVWALARTTAEDLFGYPETGHRAGWQSHIRLDREFDRARMMVHRIIESAPRVCLGRGYDVPETMFGGDSDGVRTAHDSTAHLIELFWNAPKLTTDLYGEVMLHADLDGVPGRDSREEIGRFLIEHLGLHIIPVKM